MVQRERERFITRQPPIGEKYHSDSENSWISDGLPISSRRRRRGEGRGEGGEWREKWSTCKDESDLSFFLSWVSKTRPTTRLSGWRTSD